jgi:hypothetical protein
LYLLVNLDELQPLSRDGVISALIQVRLQRLTNDMDLDQFTSSKSLKHHVYPVNGQSSAIGKSRNLQPVRMMLQRFQNVGIDVYA